MYFFKKKKMGGGGGKTLNDKLCRKYTWCTRQQYNTEYIQSIIRRQMPFKILL
jgi:hypothetical protein